MSRSINIYLASECKWKGRRDTPSFCLPEASKLSSKSEKAGRLMYCAYYFACVRPAQALFCMDLPRASPTALSATHALTVGAATIIFTFLRKQAATSGFRTPSSECAAHVSLGGIWMLLRRASVRKHLAAVSLGSAEWDIRARSSHNSTYAVMLGNKGK